MNEIARWKEFCRGQAERLRASLELQKAACDLAAKVDPSPGDDVSRG